MKIVNIFFCIIFIIFAGLQYNDPDPYIWMPIYLYSAALCYLASQKKFYPKGYLAGIIVYLAYAVYLFFDKYGVIDWASEHQAENIAQSMKAGKPWIEETREFFGLLILIIALSINWMYSKKFKRSTLRR
ncbi:transmembrane 220 family protein [Rubrolithibacter danxiaensis]|uniref:transmembrane 220 family protein n=1 Tax=Rubrolithibacter danxiaensis TaxID=3390805 RepID=UPI003BF7D754